MSFNNSESHSLGPCLSLPMALFYSVCGWGTFHCIYVHLLYPYSSVSEHSAGVHIPAIVECCNEHWGARILSSYDFLWIYARSGITGSYGRSILSFLSISILFSISLFSTPSPAFTVSRLFDDGHSSQCEVIPHCTFDLHFPDNNEVKHVFMCLEVRAFSHIIHKNKFKMN